MSIERTRQSSDDVYSGIERLRFLLRTNLISDIIVLIRYKKIMIQKHNCIYPFLLLNSVEDMHRNHIKDDRQYILVPFVVDCRLFEKQ